MMTLDRFREITSRYSDLRIVVVGDFCLDRYFEIDPTRAEVSIETGLPVHNVTRVRAQPGGAGTVLGNLVALGVGQIDAIGFCGDDGEGFELKRALTRMKGVRLDHFITTDERKTFTYGKPLLLEEGRPPVELNRLDTKNWTETPVDLITRLAESVEDRGRDADGVIVLDQVDRAETGVVTRRVLEAIGRVAERAPGLPILCDSRQGLSGWPPLNFKMNAAELRAMLGRPPVTVAEAKEAARSLAIEHERAVFVTLAERGILGASPEGIVDHVEALPLRGPIDIVGAGDSVTANLTAALAAGASVREAIELAVVASSLVIHQLGTTGSASVTDLEGLLRQVRAAQG